MKKNRKTFLPWRYGGPCGRMLHSTLMTGDPGSACASSCVGTPLWAPADGGGRSHSVGGCGSSPLDGKRARKDEENYELYKLSIQVTKSHQQQQKKDSKDSIWASSHTRRPHSMDLSIRLPEQLSEKGVCRGNDPIKQVVCSGPCGPGESCRTLRSGHSRWNVQIKYMYSSAWWVKAPWGFSVLLVRVENSLKETIN